MLRIIGMTVALAVGYSTFASAQTALTGEITCGQPTAEHRMEALSQPGHSFVLRQGLCRFTKPATINGVAQVEETFVGIQEINGGAALWRGRNTSKMANGDLIFVRLECTSSVANDGTETGGECRWTMVGGTGKMKGIAGSGTSRQANKADPNSAWVFDGSYKITP